jgi:F-type H+-transporting ATPase subunit b
VDLVAVASDVGRLVIQLTTEEGAATETTFQVNLFQVVIAAANFVVFLVLLYVFALKPVARLLEDRRSRIEQGLKDAEQARTDRENAEAERVATLAEARKEANDILSRAQKVAQESRETDIAATKHELERLRERAAEEIEAEKQRAIAELRGEVADLALAAAGRVVGESMNDERQRRLVGEFLAAAGDDEADRKN